MAQPVTVAEAKLFLRVGHADEDGLIGMLLAVLAIYNATYHLGGSLLRTLHKDVFAIYRHLHRIETHNLADGIRSGSLHDTCGYREILQFIIHKIDTIILGTLGKDGERF